VIARTGFEGQQAVHLALAEDALGERGLHRRQAERRADIEGLLDFLPPARRTPGNPRPRDLPRHEPNLPESV
jgi:hypothetical protein